MNQVKLASTDIVELTQEMIKTGYMKHEVQEHLISLGVSFAEAHETVENLYRYNANSKHSYFAAKGKKNFWRSAIGLVNTAKSANGA
jgi:hypothetical protein